MRWNLLLIFSLIVVTSLQNFERCFSPRPTIQKSLKWEDYWIFIFYILWKVKQNYSYRRRNIFNSNIFNIYVRGNFILIEKNFIATVILLTTLQYRNFCLLNAHSLQSSSSSIKHCIRAVKCSIGSTTGFHNHREAPTRAFSWLKAPTSAFTFKTLLRHYA